MGEWFSYPYSLVDIQCSLLLISESDWLIRHRVFTTSEYTILTDEMTTISHSRVK